MTEIGLLVLLAVVLAFHGWTERRNARDRDRLVAAILARNAGEYAGTVASVEHRKPSPSPRRVGAEGFQVGG